MHRFDDLLPLKSDQKSVVSYIITIVTYGV